MAAAASSTKMLQASVRRVLRPLAGSRTPRKILPRWAPRARIERREPWRMDARAPKLNHPAGSEVVDLGRGEPQEAAVDLAVVLSHPGPRPRERGGRPAEPGNDSRQREGPDLRVVEFDGHPPVAEVGIPADPGDVVDRTRWDAGGGQALRELLEGKPPGPARDLLIELGLPAPAPLIVGQPRIGEPVCPAHERGQPAKDVVVIRPDHDVPIVPRRIDAAGRDSGDPGPVALGDDPELLILREQIVEQAEHGFGEGDVDLLAAAAPAAFLEGGQRPTRAVQPRHSIREG